MISPPTQSSPRIAVTRIPSTPRPSDHQELICHGIDLGVLSDIDEDHVAGEADLIVELIDLYIKDASNKLADIKQALGGADLASLNRAAHYLMGSSATLGAHGMALLCQKLQWPISTDSPANAGELMCKLEDEFSRVRLVFSAERERRLS